MSITTIYIYCSVLFINIMTDWEDEDHEEDDDDDLAPLVRSSVKPLEVVSSSSTPNIVVSSRRSIILYGGFLLLLVVLSLYCYHQQHSHNNFSKSNNNDNINHHQCTSNSIKELLENVSNSTNYYCDETLITKPENCKCINNPMEPHLRSSSNKNTDLMEAWDATFERNKIIAAQLDVEDNKVYDVIFFGDSITEHWQGTSKGKHNNKNWEDISSVFQEEFTIKGGGRIDGLALGIGGDRCSQLLYRLQNGELPSSLNSKVYFVLIGINDIGIDKCSASSVVAGNIQIVEEIRRRKPTSTIVINSILPIAPSKQQQQQQQQQQRDEDIFDNPKWKVVSNVNHKLECYASTTQNVEFFNATSIFMTDDGVHTERSFYVDPVHPSATGSRAWARGIVNKVLDLTNN